MASAKPTRRAGTRPAFENVRSNSLSLKQRAKENEDINAKNIANEVAKILEKQKKQEKELTPEQRAAQAAEEKRKRKVADWKARKKFKQSILQNVSAGPSQHQGAMEKADHLAGLTAEGIAGEIAINLIIFCLEAFGNTPWWVQTLQLQESLVKEIASLTSDQPERICYLPDDNGVFPEIYPADGEGKVDFSRSPLRPEEVTPNAIRANGYIPQPSILEGFQIVNDFHCERMSGTNSLGPEQRARMYNVFGSDSKKEDKSEKDVVSDRIAIKPPGK